MKSIPTFVFAAALALGACAGAQTKQDTLDDDKDDVAETLSAEECESMVDHIASLSEELDREAALADCTETGTRAELDCVMAAENQSALDTCGGEPPEDTPPGDGETETDVGTGDPVDDAEATETDG